jgi:hypothetical protein
MMDADNIDDDGENIENDSPAYYNPVSTTLSLVWRLEINLTPLDLLGSTTATLDPFH